MKNTILEFKFNGQDLNNGEIFKIFPCGNYGKSRGIFKLKSMLYGDISIKDESFIINKIRRESDSEVFEIGDSVIYTGFSTIYDGKVFKIKNFDYRETDGQTFVNNLVNIELIKKTDSFVKEREAAHLNRRMSNIKRMIDILGFLTGNDLIVVREHKKTSTDNQMVHPATKSYFEKMEDGVHPKFNEEFDELMKNQIDRMNNHKPLFTLSRNYTVRKNSPEPIRIYWPKSCTVDSMIDFENWFKSISVKTPLFLSESGKEIFEKDNYYTVNYKKTQVAKMFEVFGPFTATVKPTADIKYFSTKEEAEEWIIQNKPLFSMKDLLQLEPAPIHVIRDIVISKLKENA